MLSRSKQVFPLQQVIPLSARPVILLGGGGHATVCFDLLTLLKVKILGYADVNDTGSLPVPHLGDDSVIDLYDVNDVLLVNGIGLMPGRKGMRRSIYERFKSKGFRFMTLVHPCAIRSPSSTLYEGAQVFAGGIVQVNATIGENAIVNSGAVIEHGAEVGNHAHVAPNATICGDALIEEEVFVGAGAVVVQGVSVSSNCVIPANHCVRASVLSSNERFCIDEII